MKHDFLTFHSPPDRSKCAQARHSGDPSECNFRTSIDPNSNPSDYRIGAPSAQLIRCADKSDAQNPEPTDDRCLFRTTVAWQPCLEDTIAERRAEALRKFHTLRTWQNNRQSCAAALATCTGQQTCDLSICKPEKLEFTLTNELDPAFNNSAVRFFFYGGLKQQTIPNYSERLTCHAGLTPILLTLEASWGLFTSYSFNATTDAPLIEDGGPGLYYDLDPVALRAMVVEQDSSARNAPAMTFKAEYKCECPLGYDKESTSFNNITSCRRCAHGKLKEQRDCILVLVDELTIFVLCCDAKPRLCEGW